MKTTKYFTQEYTAQTPLDSFYSMRFLEDFFRMGVKWLA
jgi:hypothetical protein